MRSPDRQIANLALRGSRPARVALISAAVWLVAGLGLHTGSSDAVAVASVNSADGMIMWTGCGDLPTLTDAELDAWKSKGVDGFACTFGQLKDTGGTNALSGNASAPLGGILRGSRGSAVRKWSEVGAVKIRRLVGPDDPAPDPAFPAWSTAAAAIGET